MEMISKIYKNKKVIITGHTGFKGSWLCFWLFLSGAEIYGISNNIPTKPSLYNILNIKKKIKRDYRVNIEDYKKIKKIVELIKPDIIFHLAAQALVKKSYIETLKTFSTNTIGTLNILDIIYNSKKKTNLVLITSDKVYKNLDTGKKYVETSKIGGDDPYSSSKGAADIIANSYKFLFKKKGHKIVIARAGNVIGGGDWAEDRLVSDCFNSWKKNKAVKIRNQYSTRPWQHVLEPLSGYLLAGYYLLSDKKNITGEAFNFGPSRFDNKTVRDIILILKKKWSGLKIIYEKEHRFTEHYLLQLSSKKAEKILNWRSVLSFNETIKFTAEWYKALRNNQKINKFTINQIKYFEKKFYKINNFKI
jgi:CDP-glucose 4,6-dehydratase